MRIKNLHTTNALAVLNIVFIIIIIFLVVYSQRIKNSQTGKITHERGGKYLLTNPILDFELSHSYKNTTISRYKTEELVDDLKKKYGTRFISLYYRDLNNGPWVGFNEKEYFSPASMLKTPLMISFFKYVENYPEIISKNILVTQEDFVNIPTQYQKNTNELKPGSTYSMLELVERMIKNSDNVAARLVQKNIPQSYIDETYKQIGDPLILNDSETLIRIKDMALFFRILFNASYLNRQHSEQALKILSESTYVDGIVAGLPKNITTAHKFGERIPEGVLLENKILIAGDIQLHECGVVYYPGQPYILCVMTRGDNFENQQNVIREISNYFYKEVEK